MATQIEKAAEEYSKRNFNWSNEQEASAKSYIAGASAQYEIDREVIEKINAILIKARNKTLDHNYSSSHELIESALKLTEKQ